MSGILAGAAALPAQAHHSFAMFDHAQAVTLKGTVESFTWTNPHVHFTVMVAPDPKSGVPAGKWDVEGGSTNIMFRQGWTRVAIKPGDPVTVVGFPMKDGTHAVSLIYTLTPDGKKLWHDVNRPSIVNPN